MDKKTHEELLEKFFEAGNKFRANNPFEQIEKTIISEMKSDLHFP